jgi:peptide/nickel transport system substrate-binding protein
MDMGYRVIIKRLGSALLALTLLGLVACGGSEEAAPAAAPAAPQIVVTVVVPAAPAAPAAPDIVVTVVAAPVATPTPAGAPTRTPTGVQKYGGTVKVVPQGGLKSLDNMIFSGVTISHLTRHVLEGLFHPDAAFNVQPMMVDTWEISEDRLTWRFNLREDIYFHDGQPVKAEDHVGTFKRVGKKAYIWNKLVSIFGATMEAEGDYVLVVKVTKPTALVIDSLQFQQNWAPAVVPSEIYSLPEDKAAETVIGAGPFKFLSWAPGDRWIAERWEDYQPRSEIASGTAGNRTAYVDRIEFIEIPDVASKLAALETGQVHLLDVFPPDFAPRVRANPELNLFMGPPGSSAHVTFNNIRPPFDDVRVRQAVQLGYPSEKAMRAIAGDPANWQLCHIAIGCGTKWDTSKTREDSKKYLNLEDLEGARQIIKDTGNVGTKVRIQWPQDVPTMSNHAIVTSEFLKDIGLDPELVAMDWATTRVVRADPDLWEVLHTWTGPSRNQTPLTRTSYQKDGWYNKYQDETGKMTGLWEEFTMAQTDVDQLIAWEKINAFIYEEVPRLVVGEFFAPYAARKELKGFKPDPDINLWGVWLEP